MQGEVEDDNPVPRSGHDYHDCPFTRRVTESRRRRPGAACSHVDVFRQRASQNAPDVLLQVVEIRRAHDVGNGDQTVTAPAILRYLSGT